MLKVSKFGGSSVANAQQIKKVQQIIASDPTRKIVVTSASGKEHAEDHKVTDLLYLCYEHKRYGMPVDSMFNLIKDKLLSIENELGLATQLAQDIDALYQELQQPIELDYLVSRGEYLTAKLLSHVLDYTFIDAKDLLFFKYNGELDYEKMKLAFNQLEDIQTGIVVPGFYGAFPNGEIHLMSRGGSDVTGSILANLANAERYENWTDVSGILKADPRLVKNPRQIDIITYEELRELSYMGASVIHEEAVYPVKDKNIPIYILNTNDSKNDGTIILNKVDAEKRHAITGIAGKQEFSAITLVKEHMSSDFGTIRKALEVLESYQLKVEHISTAIDTFSLVVQSSQLKPIYYDLVHDLKKVCQATQINVTHELSLIAIVSRFMKEKTGMSGRVFTALGEQNINISLISQTGNETNIILAVKNQDYKKTIQTIYSEFEGDDSIEKS
ncbi:aspartate kinase [Vagococcus silagei]|uniref:Aspartokinase n=1 Tax=Vagococcus silagei TaxID=2508885 RepID=A0A4S3B569_9ENTE|nr:aspartate kinase [Vagococcus silagei]THB62251.1 aspartate kinase [Vagococcus silagei]